MIFCLSIKIIRLRLRDRFIFIGFLTIKLNWSLNEIGEKRYKIKDRNIYYLISSSLIKVNSCLSETPTQYIVSKRSINQLLTDHAQLIKYLC